MIIVFSVLAVDPSIPAAQRVFTDIKLDANGDIDVSTGDLQLLPDLDAVMQDISIRLQTFEGEWFLDTTEGMPYYQDILIKNPQTNTIRGIFSEAILGTPGVTKLVDLKTVYDVETRELSVSFSGEITINGNPIPFDYNKKFVIGKRT